MDRPVVRALQSAALCLVLGLEANAQLYSEDFESYAPGSLLDGQGGWEGWELIPDPVSQVTDAQASSGTRSVRFAVGSDVVQEFDLHTGRWELTLRVLVPTGATGLHYIVFMNQYLVPGFYQWAGQLILDAGGSSQWATCQCGGNFFAPLVLDEWVEVRLVMDFDADTGDLYYDGALLASWVWTEGWNGQQNHGIPGFEALDLWGANGSGIYVDDVRLTPAGPVGTPFCDGGGCPCANDNDGSQGVAGCANSSSPGGGALRGSGSASLGYADFALDAEGLVPFQPALFFQGDETIGAGAGAPFGDGLRCVGVNVVRLETRTPLADGSASTTVDVGAVGGVSAGDLKRYQCWYRDPLGGPCGAGFNLTNGLELVWLP